MNWLRKSFWSNFCYKRAYICGQFSNEIRSSRAQYFSSLSNGHRAQLLVCKCKRLEQNFSVFEAVRSIQPSFLTFSKQSLKNWFAYVPLFGAIRYEELGLFWFKTFDELDTEEFRILFDMPDTFFSRFKIIELHVWMLLFNLPKECRIDTHIKNGIIKAMWMDAEFRGKLVDKYNTKFKADFKILYNKFKVSLVIYDNGYGTSDTALSSALWYNFFDRRDIDPRLLEGLVEYIRHQMHKLGTLNYNELTMDYKKQGIWSSPRPFVRHLKN